MSNALKAKCCCGRDILQSIRAHLLAASLDAVIVPSSDPHNSEYVAERFKVRGHVSNFRGSSGTCLVTQTDAMLWTDGRYWLEAARTLYPDWTLMKDGQVGVLSMEDWLERRLGPTAAVAVDPLLVTIAAWEKLAKKVNLKPMANIAPAVDVPSEEAPKTIYLRPAVHCGATSEEKLLAVIAAVKAQYPDTLSSSSASSVDVLVVSALDEVAWLTNLRGGNHVPYNPVFYSYALVDVRRSTCTVFLDESLMSPEDRSGFLEASPSFALAPYDQMLTGPIASVEGARVLVDENQSSYGLLQALNSTLKAKHVKQVPLGPIPALKAKKNVVELQGFVDCHVRDGVALTRYLAWLTAAINSGVCVNEHDAAKELESFRRQENYFVQLSFESISASGANGAIIHYAPPTDGTADRIDPNALYLIDSGAQYLDGTTDVTRTVTFTTSPTQEEKEMYTLVLKGHIALNTCRFPVGTTGHRIDAFARRALWDQGLNYAHGTGHGVGSFLNVHEGPHGIGMRPTLTGAPLEESMICSNEPGFYKSGAFGIRIENLEQIVKVATAHNNGTFLTFDSLTMAPLCRDLIDATLLTEAEITWVNGYHDKVRTALTPGIQLWGDTTALLYLERHCTPI